MATVRVPDQLPEAVTRPRQHVEAVLAQSLVETGPGGRAALAWAWALTGTRPSPVTLSLPTGKPPSREQILTEAGATPEGSTAPPGVPADFCDQISETRRILTWLAGSSAEIPVDGDNRGLLVGARDDYARTDDDIRQVRDYARHGLACHDSVEPGEVSNGHYQAAGRISQAWLRGVRDLLDWVLGERLASPLGNITRSMPTAHDLSYEQGAAGEIVAQPALGGIPPHPATGPAPQYGEAIRATITWLRGETSTPPAGAGGESVYRAPLLTAPYGRPMSAPAESRVPRGAIRY